MTKCSVCKGSPAILKSSGTSTGYCKECKKSYAKEHYRRNKIIYISRAKARNKTVLGKLRQIARKARQVPCTDCKKSYPYYVMDFDHVRGKKGRSVSRSMSGFISQMPSPDRLLEEIAKCDVVCANCHRERTYGKGSGS